MKQALIIAAIIFSVNLFGQSKSDLFDSIKRSFVITDEKLNILYEINERDTVIYDAPGTIRTLLKLYYDIIDENRKYQNDLFRARQLLESVNSIMFFKPNPKTKYFKL